MGFELRRFAACLTAAFCLLAAPAAADSPEVATRLEALAVNPVAPALDLAGLDGTLYRIADFRGQAVVVAFWATWCGPCRREIPALDRLARRLQGRNVAVLAVDYGEPAERVERFLERHGVASLTVLFDRNRRAARRWLVGTLPVAYAVDPQGTVRLGVKGEVDWESPEVERQLLELAGTGGR